MNSKAQKFDVQLPRRQTQESKQYHQKPQVYQLFHRLTWTPIFYKARRSQFSKVWRYNRPLRKLQIEDYSVRICAETLYVVCLRKPWSFSPYFARTSDHSPPDFPRIVRRLCWYWRHAHVIYAGKFSTELGGDRNQKPTTNDRQGEHPLSPRTQFADKPVGWCQVAQTSDTCLS